MGDFNSDGHLDAISGAKIYLNDTTGTGTFVTFDTPNTVTGQGIGGIAIGDVDDDEGVGASKLGTKFGVELIPGGTAAS